MKLIGIFLLVALICLYEVPRMRKQKMKKELLLFSIILSLATILAVLKIQGVNIPNPAEGLKSIISPIGLGVESFLKVKGT